jgi:APA family basic amino acid/polyamine antiporter
MGIWSRKSVTAMRQEAGAQSGHLRRSLGVVSLTAFGVGSTIGAGIFVLTGAEAAHHAGPAVTFSFMLASLACFFAGLCYAEFAAMVPVAGSAYSYAYATMGELVAWIIGWCISLEYVFSAALVAIGWSGYAQSAFGDLGVHLPQVLTAAPFRWETNHVVVTGTWIDLPAVLVTLACTLLLLVSTRQSAIVNTVIVCAKVAAIIIIIVVGVHYVDPANWQPFIPPNTGGYGNFGWTGVATAAGVVFFSYIGFDGISTLAEDCHHPQRTIPLSLFLALAICTALYVGVSLVVTGLTKYTGLDVPDPIYHALSTVQADLGWLKVLVAVVAVFGLISVILLSLLGQVRILYAMGRDGLLPAALTRTSPRFGTPHVGTLWTGAVAAVTAGLTPLDVLTELISIGTLLAFAMVCAGILVLRRTDPHHERPFRTPWVPLVPVLGILCCTYLMYSLPIYTWKRLFYWLLIGILLYAAYGYRHSKLAAAGAPPGAGGAR